MPDFRPSHILVFHRPVEGGVDIAHPFLGDGIGTLSVDFGHGKQQFFQGLGKLGFHFFRIGAWIDARNDALPYGESRKLVFFHVDEGIDAKSHDDRNNHPNNLLVIDASADDALIL